MNKPSRAQLGQFGPCSTPTIPYLNHNPTLPYPTLPLHYPIPPHRTAPQPATPHHITTHHTTLHHTTPHYTTPHHITPHHTTPHHTLLYLYPYPTIFNPYPILPLPYPPLPYFTPTIPHPYHTLPQLDPTPTISYPYHTLLYILGKPFLLKGNFIKIFSVSYYHKPGNEQMVLRDVICQGSLIRIIFC